MLAAGNREKRTPRVLRFRAMLAGKCHEGRDSNPERQSAPHRVAEGPLRQPKLLTAVLVVAPDPDLELLVLVAALRYPVEDPVKAHQELDPTSPG